MGALTRPSRTEKILCVDDDANILGAYKRRLGKRFVIETATGGEAGIAAVGSKGPFAVIVTDLRMPGMDGAQFLAKVQEQTPDSVCVMLTGHRDVDAAIAAVNEGNVFRFLTKPCPPETLRKTLEAALDQYRLIAEHKQALGALQESEARYRGLIEGSIQGLYIYQDALVRFANPAMAATFGYASAHELIGQDFRILVQPHEHSRLEDYGAACLRGDPVPTRDEFQGRCQDGALIWIESLVSRVAWNGKAAILVTCLDITHRKEVEHLKDEVISTVSHELRTPLTSLRGFAELMLHYDFPPEKQHQFLTVMRNETVRLANLINDFLDIQRLESGHQPYNFASIDLVALVDEAVTVFACEDGKHAVRVAVPATLALVRADADRIRQVLSNLLSNAVKYAPRGGEITVGARQESTTVVVWVADQGIGMTSDAVQKLFTKFYRVDNAETRSISGTGLGLALVKEIIEAHEGRVWVESTFGTGSTFFFSLPAADTMQQEAP